MQSNPTFSQWASFIAAGIAVVAAVYVGGNRSQANRSSVAFADVQAVMQQSAAGKSIQEQLAPKQKELQKAAEAKLKELKEEQDDLTKRRESMSESKFAASSSALQKKIDDWNATAQKRDATLNEAAKPAAQKVQETVREQIEKIAAENKYTAILPLQGTLYSDRGLDVTSELIRRVDAELPKISISFDDTSAK